MLLYALEGMKGWTSLRSATRDELCSAVRSTAAHEFLQFKSRSLLQAPWKRNDDDDDETADEILGGF